MIFCILIEFIILLWIVLDILELTRKSIHQNLLGKCEFALIISFFLIFIIIFIGGFNDYVMTWMNNNSGFYMVYLFSALVWTILNIFIYHKKDKNL